MYAPETIRTTVTPTEMPTETLVFMKYEHLVFDSSESLLKSPSLQHSPSRQQLNHYIGNKIPEIAIELT
jgi:hypothetical protein